MGLACKKQSVFQCFKIVMPYLEMDCLKKNCDHSHLLSFSSLRLQVRLLYTINNCIVKGFVGFSSKKSPDVLGQRIYSSTFNGRYLH